MENTCSENPLGDMAGLKINSEILKSIIECDIDQAIILTDIKEKILMWNKGAQIIYGYSFEEIKDKSLSDLHLKEDSKYNNFSNEYSNGQKVYANRKDGLKFPVSIEIAKRLDSKGNIIGSLVISRNITDADNLEKLIKERTQELREKDALLAQAGKLATLGEMAAGIAHEINQPLGGIGLITQGLLVAQSKGILDNEFLVKKLNSINEQVERINKIITHLRTFARQSDNIKQAVDIKNPILDVFKLVGQQLIKKDVSLELDLCDETLTVLADHNRLEQVFLNLISNARDALDDLEEKLLNNEVLTKDKGNWQKKILIKSFIENQNAVIEVSDTGYGISQNVINKIFEPFFTTKGIGKGTGIGLSITYGIIKEFGGTIEVRSKELEGTTFTLKMPLICRNENNIN